MPPELVPPALPAALVVVVALRCRTVPPPPPALGDAPALGDRPPPPTFVALAAGPGYKKNDKITNGCVHVLGIINYLSYHYKFFLLYYRRIALTILVVYLIFLL